MRRGTLLHPVDALICSATLAICHGEHAQCQRWGDVIYHVMKMRSGMREHRANAGEGHLYQGRFKAFPVQSDPHLLGVLGYVEANPLQARIAGRVSAAAPFDKLTTAPAWTPKRVQLAE